MNQSDGSDKSDPSDKITVPPPSPSLNLHLNLNLNLTCAFPHKPDVPLLMILLFFYEHD